MMLDFLRDLFGFLAARKRYWLFPALFFLIALAGLIIIGGGSAAAPFIYTLF